jgi:hypothetical protein
MMAVYHRIGLHAESSLVRMVKLLRADEKIAAKVPIKALARVMSGVVNPFLAARPFSLRLRSGVEVALHQGRCGQEFTELAQSIGEGLGTRVDRSAEYLNWRFLDHPKLQYHTLTARHRGKLEGYLVFSQEGARTTVVDWLSREPGDLRNDLVRGLVQLLRSQGCESVQAAVLAGHPYQNDLQSLGFRPRESAPVIFIRPNREGSPSKAASGNWFLMDGDREG